MKLAITPLKFVKLEVEYLFILSYSFILIEAEYFECWRHFSRTQILACNLSQCAEFFIWETDRNPRCCNWLKPIGCSFRLMESKWKFTKYHFGAGKCQWKRFIQFNAHSAEWMSIFAQPCCLIICIGVLWAIRSQNFFFLKKTAKESVLFILGFASPNRSYLSQVLILLSLCKSLKSAVLSSNFNRTP